MVESHSNFSPDPGTPPFYQVIRALSVTIFPLLLIAFIGLYRIDPDLYLRQLREDGLIEWLTFVLLSASGLLSLLLVIQTRARSKHVHWFFVAFGVICIVGALEEISWGQRVFDIEVPEFFRKHSDQQELNAHNVLQQWLDIKTKHVTGIVLFFYGVCLPGLAFHHKVRTVCDKIDLVVPPFFLSLGFLISALMMFDEPTRQEEEIGEFLFSLCFALFMVFEHLARRGRASEEPGVGGMHVNPASDILAVVLGVGLAVLGILAVWFNDDSVAGEGDLLTYVSVVLLLLVSAAALGHVFRVGGWERWLWVLIGGGFIYLTLDEYYLFHERLDWWMHRTFDIKETDLSDELDGAIVLLYGVIALGVIVMFRNIMRRYRGSLTLLAVAFTFLLLMIIVDLLHTDFYFDTRYFEESCKVLSEYFFLLAFVVPYGRSTNRRVVSVLARRERRTPQ